ncbi:glycoside hydrolase family 88/105 protein [Saccharophagus degradans]|uniref:Unsaturated uronyl hydrolase-like protein n=1 Tax=Saccharophagus degradans (strain 2-40 / ATCC 43961 / DSM 17024) TaxID=203122 RepID=Q21DM8_SACD2|nr:glycoside hydrolase family 88 protein [Saccharophagus degradans]ABD83201.1 unsaturated uronyl hydrolase-like protein [Saccharophagus degradans 2-40]
MLTYTITTKRLKLYLALPLASLLLLIPLARANTNQTQALELGFKVADYQLQQLDYLESSSPTPEPKSHSKSWEIGAFWLGLTQFTDLTQHKPYQQALIKQGENNQWQLGPWLEFADDHIIGQSYLWAAKNGVSKTTALSPMRKSFDKILANPPNVHLSFYFGEQGYGSAECLMRWCWCDALFMAPQAFIGLSQATGDMRYANYAFKEFWATTDFLYDPAEKLYFRDSRFFEKRDHKQRKLFWSRGNGWVFGGIVNILKLLPQDHPQRPRLETLYLEMAARLIQLQKPDGYWPPSLLAPKNSPPETSGTAFFTYGLAYGINTGLLDKKRYLPAVTQGWQALTQAVNKNGELGWVQQVSDRPESVAKTDTHYYGVGAFLLAATEVAQLNNK